MTIGIRPCSWSAGGRPGFRSPHASTQLGVDTLIVDRWPRIGDNWRRRYHALTLHNQVHVNHLPYMPFPPNWPSLHSQGQARRLVRGLCRGDGAQLLDRPPSSRAARMTKGEERWSVVLRRADGTRREMHPRHVVMATGVSGIPNLPDIPASAQLRRHDSAFQPVRGRRGRGRAGTSSSSAPATAATTSRRTCIRAAPGSRSCNAARP